MTAQIILFNILSLINYWISWKDNLISYMASPMNFSFVPDTSSWKSPNSYLLIISVLYVVQDNIL